MQKAQPGDCTVTVCHSSTRNIKEICREADIIVAALGRPGFVTEDTGEARSRGNRRGAPTRVPDASRKSGFRLCGDVDFDNVAPKCSLHNPGSRRRRPDDDMFTDEEHASRTQRNILISKLNTEAMAAQPRTHCFFYNHYFTPFQKVFLLFSLISFLTGAASGKAIRKRRAAFRRATPCSFIRPSSTRPNRPVEEPTTMTAASVS